MDLGAERRLPGMHVPRGVGTVGDRNLMTAVDDPAPEHRDAITLLYAARDHVSELQRHQPAVDLHPEQAGQAVWTRGMIGLP